jgi:RNA polymerase sigma-70 factor (ECF subfamily)
LDLIQQWQTGDLDAFEELFHRYKDMVFRTSLLMVGDEHRAEDMLQEAFVKVHKSKDKFKGDESGFRQWLYRITINICIDSHRKEPRPALSLEEMGEQCSEPAETGSAYTKLEEKDAIWQAMKSLDVKHRLVVILRYFHGLPYEEIAQVLDIPVGTVRSRLNTAIKTLRRVLVSEDEKEVA